MTVPTATQQPSPERLTVVLVAHHIHDHGGMERAYYELIRRSAAEIDFVVVASELAEELRPLAEWRHVAAPARPAPLRVLAFFLTGSIGVARARRELRRRGRGPVLVHVLGAVVAARADIATLQFCHTAFVADNRRLTPPNAPLSRRLNTGLLRLIALAAERWCFRLARVRLLAPVSASTQAEAARHFPTIPSAITPNGVDVERFRPDPAARAAVRSELGTADDALVAIFVGGDWDRKGLGEAITGAAAARAATDTQLELWVVGDGDAQRFGRLATEAGIESSVRFLGRQSTTERYYAAADIFVLPTLYETFSLVAYEAAATGLPIVATPVSGIDELLAGDGAGIAVERNADQVADALIRLAGDPELRERYGAEGRHRAAAFDWSRSVEAVRELYRRLMTAGA